MRRTATTQACQEGILTARMRYAKADFGLLPCNFTIDHVVLDRKNNKCCEKNKLPGSEAYQSKYLGSAGSKILDSFSLLLCLRVREIARGIDRSPEPSFSVHSTLLNILAFVPRHLQATARANAGPTFTSHHVRCPNASKDPFFGYTAAPSMATISVPRCSWPRHQRGVCYLRNKGNEL